MAMSESNTVRLLKNCFLFTFCPLCSDIHGTGTSQDAVASIQQWAPFFAIQSRTLKLYCSGGGHA